MADLLNEMALLVEQRVEVAAGPDKTFAALLEQLGPAMDTMAGDLLPMKLEAWPGGRWYRDLGDQNGHLWGHVQVIKRPTLLEIYGPMFMSYAAVSHIQFGVASGGDRSVLSLRHQAIGLIDEAHRAGVVDGWRHCLQAVRRRAQ